MSQAEIDKHRIEGFKAAIAVVRRMAMERGGMDFWTTKEWLERNGKARWYDFDKVEAL